MAFYRPLAVAASVTAVLGTFSLTASAQNNGFETGDFSSWSVLKDGEANTAVVTTTKTYHGAAVNSVEGTKFAVITSGSNSANNIESFLGIANNSLKDIYKTRSGTAIKRTIVANAGDTVSFSYNFLGWDKLPANDYGFTSLTPATGVTILSNILTVGDYGSSGWQNFRYTFAQAGTYTFGVGAFNVWDNANPTSSKIAVDNFAVTSPVYLSAIPEPSEYAFAAFAGLSIVGLVVRARRRVGNGAA
jgi:hypothetical protein